jgi:hypothetical protein
LQIISNPLSLNKPTQQKVSETASGKICHRLGAQVEGLQKSHARLKSLAKDAASPEGESVTPILEPPVNRGGAVSNQEDSPERSTRQRRRTQPADEGDTIEGEDLVGGRVQTCRATEAVEHQEDQNTWWSRAIAATLLIGQHPPPRTLFQIEGSKTLLLL